jgi:acetyl esterase/lipase
MTEDQERIARIHQKWNDYLDANVTVPLWENETPNHDESMGQRRPSLLVSPAKGKPRGMVIVCAGGAYLVKALYEGKKTFEKIRETGMGVALLDYRLKPYALDVTLSDAQRAIRLVRARATEWNVLPDKIAILGFSAGGHLAGMAATKYDEGDPGSPDPVECVSSRPDAAVQCYGSISVVAFPSKEDRLTDSGTEHKRKIAFSPEKNLREDSPPFFLWQTGQDEIIDPRQMLNMAKELTDRGIPYEMHLFPNGVHGVALADGDNPHGIPADTHTARWFELCVEWLEELGF